MHAFLIVGSSAESRLTEAKRRLSSYRVVLSDGLRCIVIDCDEAVQGSGSIEHIRELKRWLGHRSDTRRGVLISDAEGLTLPGQHALLKLLEEPGEGTMILLTAQDPDSLISTIRSRCHIVRLIGERDESPRDGKTVKIVLSDIRALLGLRPSRRIVWLHHALVDQNMVLNQSVIETTVTAIAKLVSENGEGMLTTTERARILRQSAVSIAQLRHHCSPALVIQQFLLDIGPAH